ncbi:MAG: HlyD family secretion protein [bacterium]
MRHTIIQIFLLTVLAAGCQNRTPGQFNSSGIVEGTAVRVAAQTPGLILDIYVDEGDVVKMGQTIAVIDTEKLLYQMDQIEAGFAEIDAQRDINRNIYAKAKLDFDHVKTKYARFQELYSKNSASKQVVEDLKSAYDLAGTQLENARQNLLVIESKQKGLEAQLKLLKRQIRDATISAVISGTVTAKYFEKGEIAPPGAAMVEIIDLSKMWTKVYVSQTLLSRIKIGQNAIIHIDGIDRTLTGRVSWISAKAEFTPKNILTDESRASLVYAVKVAVDNPEGILKHGMPVEVELGLQDK